MDEFNITVRLRRNLKSRMGLAFVKGQTIRVRFSPAEFLNGFQVVSEGYSAIHPRYKDGTDSRVTIFIPKHYVTVL